MKLLLQIIAGPRDGTRHLLPEGSSFIIGRGREADLSIPEDRFLSRRHLALIHRHDRWWAKDLNSSNGSTLDNQGLTRPMALAQGQTLQAGRTRIRLSLQAHGDGLAAGVEAATPHAAPPPEAEEPATVLRRNATTLGDLAVSLFALVPRDHHPELATLLDPSEARRHWITLGEGVAGVETFHLLSLSERTDLLQGLTTTQSEPGGLVLLSSDAPLTELASHLEGLLRVRTSTGEVWHFRYYRALVLRTFLDDCPVALADRFFGPITRFLLTAPDLQTLTAFSRSARGVASRTLPIEKLCLS